MKSLIAGVLAAATLLAGQAQAQLKLPPKLDGELYSVVISKLRSVTQFHDGSGKVHPVRTSDEGLAILNVTKGGTLWGSTLVPGCAEMRTKGVSRMRYPMDGGFDMDLDTCGSEPYDFDLLWKTEVVARRGQLQIEGEITFEYHCKPDPEDCPYARLEVTERAVLRLDGSKCTLTRYELRATYLSANEKDGKTTRVSVSSPVSRCDIRYD